MNDQDYILFGNRAHGMTQAELAELREHFVKLLQIIDSLAPSPQREANDIFPVVAFGRCETATRHAVTRYRERTNATMSDGKLCKKIALRIANAEEYVLKERFRVYELLSHGVPAKYFKHGDMIFVVEGSCVITCHHGTADRWIKKDA